MKILIITILFPALLIGAAGCSAGKQVPPVSSSYNNWKRTHSVELDYPIPGHEDKYRRIFINSAGEKPEILTVKGRVTYAYPEDTQIVKEVYEDRIPQPGKEPAMLTVMIKKTGHPLARGGWLWIVKDVKSSKETIISEEFCITCHTNANEKHPYGDRNPKNEFRDYLFFPYPVP
jgi:hypothetical protein